MWFILYGFCLLSIRCDQRWQRIAERDGMTKGKQTDDIICPFVFWYPFAIEFSIYISFHYNKNEYKFQYNYKISIFSSSGRETSSRKLCRYKEIELFSKLSSKHFFAIRLVSVRFPFAIPSFYYPLPSVLGFTSGEKNKAFNICVFLT